MINKHFSFVKQFITDRFNYMFQGIAKRLVAAAIREATKKRELRYKDIMKIERGIRRHFHDDISVIVIYLDNEKASKHSKLGFTTAPIDIFSHNEDKIVEDPLLLKY